MPSPDPAVRLHDRFPTLRLAGVAAERYPRFINPVLDPHHLDVLLLTFVLSGQGHHLMGATTQKIVSPSVSVTAPGQTHSLVTDDNGLEVVNVFLDPDLHPLPNLQPPHDEALAAFLPLPSAPQVVTTDLAQVELAPSDTIAPLLDLLVQETEHPRSLDLLSSLRTALLATCAHAVIARGLIKATTWTHPSDDRVIAVRDWLDRHYREPHTLASLAQRAQLERTYFSSRFTKVVGLPSSEYIARLRIRYALSLLQATDEPIAAIARSSGFHDLSNFGRTFSRLMGRPPRQFRAETRSIRHEASDGGEGAGWPPTGRPGSPWQDAGTA
ncbi:MAG: helix-turn-helix domain-containing protein [Brachybacterium tyrofermentans]